MSEVRRLDESFPKINLYIGVTNLNLASCGYQVLLYILLLKKKTFDVFHEKAFDIFHEKELNIVYNNFKKILQLATIKFVNIYMFNHIEMFDHVLCTTVPHIFKWFFELS